MKLGLSMWSYVAAWRRGAMDIPGFVQEAARLHVAGVELLDFFWRDRDAELPQVQTALRETGLPVGVYSVSNNLAVADPAERKAQVARITDGVDNALTFGADTVRVFAGNAAPGMDLDDALLWIVEGLTDAAAYTHSQGVTLALENHGLLAGKAEQVRLILDAVGSPALRANPDTGNFLLVHEAPHEAVEQLAPFAQMAHFKDFRVVPDDYPGFAYAAVDGVKFAGAAIGEGDIDLADCLRALQMAHFKGWLNIEYEAEEDPLAGVARSVAHTQHLLENLN